MNKQNQFVGNLNPYSKPFHKATLQPDNSILHVTMPDIIKTQILQSNQNIDTFFKQFLFELKKIKALSIEPSEYKLIEHHSGITQMLKQVQQNRVIFIKIFEQMYRSFKGFCTWISITTIKTTYLIDVMKLRTDLKSLGKSIFENPNILKVGLSMKQQIQSLQRDFGFFSRTILDLKQVLVIQTVYQNFESLVKQILPQYIIPQVKQGGFYKKPINEQQLRYISLNSSLLPKITFFIQNKINEDITFLQACKMSSKQCLLAYQCQFAKIPLKIEEQIKKKNPKQARIIRKLMKWRIHTARIRDQSCQYILPLSLIQNIVSKQIKSMWQLLNQYESNHQKQICRDYDQTILDITNSQSSKIDLQKIQNEVSQCNSLNSFVKLVGWNDCNWKNENSESIRLFKEIISMDPIQSSIIENQLAQTKNRILSNDDILDLFGYIPYFNKNDQKGLQLQHSQFIKAHKQRQKMNQNQKQQQSNCKKIETSKTLRIPQSIEEIYELANEKKKQMKKQKKKSSSSEQKQEPFTIDVQKFLESIGWN